MAPDITVEVFPKSKAFSDGFVTALAGALRQRPMTLNY
jgi:hypothetical protein